MFEAITDLTNGLRVCYAALSVWHLAAAIALWFIFDTLYRLGTIPDLRSRVVLVTSTLR